MKILQKDVIANRIQFESETGFCWEINGIKHRKGFNCFSKATDGEIFSFDYMPIGLQFKGNIVETKNSMEGTTIGFCPHSNQVSRKQIHQWFREHWIKCFGNDDHLYVDIEFITYKNPKSKTGKLRTDRTNGISIQHKVNVYVWRGEKVISIPIELVVEKHPFTYDEIGNKIIREKI